MKVSLAVQHKSQGCQPYFFSEALYTVTNTLQKQLISTNYDWLQMFKMQKLQQHYATYMQYYKNNFLTKLRDFQK